MNEPQDGTESEAPRRGRKPVDAHVRLDKPARIRFSSNDLRVLGEAMAIVARATGRHPVFSSWLRDAVIEHARRKIHLNKNKP